MDTPAEPPAQAEPHRDLMIVSVDADAVIGLQPGPDNTISVFAWPTVLREAARLYEASSSQR
jgi:hypothetical protein